MILGNVDSKIQQSYSWFVRTTCDGLLHLGHEVVGVNYKKNTMPSIHDAIYRYKPDILFTHLTFHKHHDVPDILNLFASVRKVMGTKIIHTLHDAKHEPRYRENISTAFDLALVGQTQNLAKFSNYWKIPAYYTPYTSMTYKKMGVPAREYSYTLPLFTGNPDSHRDRNVFIQRLKHYGDIKVIRTKSKNDLRNKTYRLSVSSACILGLCTGYNIGGYIDVRPFQYLGAGAFMICRKFKEMDKVIPPDLYIPFRSYSNKDAKYVIDTHRKWLSIDKTSMRKKAFEFIQKYHSSKVRMDNIIKVIEGKQNSIKAMIDEF
jgi:hypothetical protein